MNTFFAFSFYFSMAFALLKRALTFFAVIIFMLSYCHACESHAKEFDKLLRTLTASNLVGHVLKIYWSGDYSMCPVHEAA